MLINNTPVEEHDGILVKREDLCCPKPGPPFSKVRGLWARMLQLKKEGYQTVGYTETSISMAGWGVAWAAKELGMKCVIFNPVYKKTPNILAYHRHQWRKFGAEIVDIKAGRARVNFYLSRTLLKEGYKAAYLLPLGLSFPEAVEATEAEGKRLKIEIRAAIKTVVVNVGSGTIAAGVAKAFQDKKVIGVMGRTGSVKGKEKQIAIKGGFVIGGLMGLDFQAVDPGWEYTDRCDFPCPFPCHPYYDRKAWQWVVENRKDLEEPILFWNIGRVA